MNSEITKILEDVANQWGVSILEVKTEIEKLIDDAWSNGKPNAEFSKTFPKGKPSIEEFILTLAAKVKDKL